MKSNCKIIAIVIALFISSVLFSKQASAQQSNISFQIFYDQLSPYGQWINYANDGYVWIPNMGSDFVPYSTGGHWVMTDYGWTWVSDYDWGWAPFHYGRWDYDNNYGWLWIPGNEWGPAWVTWRRADGYYGWEPMGPGISVSVSFGMAYNNQHDHWMFVRDRDFERSDINHYNVNRADRDRIVRNSTVINKTYYDSKRRTTYASGPAREDVQKTTGRKITPVAIQENNKPGQNLSNGQLRIYRPQVVKGNDKGKVPAPSRITNPKEVKRPAERKTENQTVKVDARDNNKKEVSRPVNTNSKPQPVQSKKENQSNNARPEKTPMNVKPKENNNNNRVQQTQTQKAKPAPAINHRSEQQQNTVKPIKTNENQPQQPKQVNPSSNHSMENQPHQEVQKDNNHKAQAPQLQKANPSGNNARERQQNNVKPENNNRNEQPKEANHEQEKKRE